jgi:hypothetical protein
MASETTTEEDGGLLHIFLLLGGGLCIGFGVVNLYFAFGYEVDGERVGLNQDLTSVGFSGLDNISRLAAADFAIPMIIVGVVLMIIANATAWKKTGGY